MNGTINSLACKIPNNWPNSISLPDPNFFIIELKDFVWYFTIWLYIIIGMFISMIITTAIAIILTIIAFFLSRRWKLQKSKITLKCMQKQH